MVPYILDIGLSKVYDMSALSQWIDDRGYYFISIFLCLFAVQLNVTVVPRFVRLYEGIIRELKLADYLPHWWTNRGKTIL